MRSSHACRTIVAILLLAMPACGPSRPAVAPVSGQITFSGKPVASGVIWFYPEKGRVATGQIGTDGRYTLGTFARADGALLGNHRVVIVAREVVPNQVQQPRNASEAPADLPDAIKQEWAADTRAAGDEKILWLVPEMYAGVASSPLRATVAPGKNAIDFALPVP